ncbi:MAG TPA: maltotransferase domain-containing protein, partial [Thermodesulfobacteriota bacterium]|nr:maltotransferase domain-containing protein [Thermodesulfobacteriota bacterium]
MELEGRKRVVIENVKPEIDCGRFPIKRVVGEKVIVTADIFSDGHDSISARLLYRRQRDKEWREIPLRLIENDRWRGEFIVDEVGIYLYTVEGWIDRFATWQRDLGKKWDAGYDLKVDLLIGAGHVEETSKRASAEDRKKLIRLAEVLKGNASIERTVTAALDGELIELMDRYPDMRFAVSYGKDLAVVVDRKKALFSTWYELFPRSCSSNAGEYGTFEDCERLLPEI